MSIHSSETLQKIHGEQPKSYELSKQIADLLSQYGLENTRIPSLLEQTNSLAQETGNKLAVLKAETLVTARLSSYEAQVSSLEERHKTKIASILSGSANNDSYERAA